MKKLIPLFFSFFVMFSCNKVSKENAQKLNGYWEIEKVVLEDGSEKEYKINTNYDFFQINADYKGFRKKVSPQFNGKFLTDDSSEAVEVVEKDGKIFLKYKTDYASWQEELKSVSDEKMLIVNQQNIEYHYKKAKPFFDGEEIK